METLKMRNLRAVPSQRRTCTPIHAQTVTEGRFTAEKISATMTEPMTIPRSWGAYALIAVIAMNQAFGLTH